MNSEPTFGAAFLGALGYLCLQLLAPLAVGFGNVTLGFWLLPLAAIFLWPRDSSIGWTITLIFLVGFAADLATGLRLGTSPLIALVWFALIRPDLRDGEFGELRLWGGFTIAIVATSLVLALVTGLFMGQGRGVFLPLLLDGLVAITMFPLVFRLLRLTRTVGREREAFP